jgi:hypothetical protein
LEEGGGRAENGKGPTTERMRRERLREKKKKREKKKERKRERKRDKNIKSRWGGFGEGRRLLGTELE